MVGDQVFASWFKDLVDCWVAASKACKLVLLSENIGTNHMTGTKLEWR